MKNIRLGSLIYFSIIFFFISSFTVSKSGIPSKREHGNTLSVIIKNIRNKKGRLQLDLYKNQEEYEARKSDDERRAYVYKSAVSKGEIKYTYTNIPDGVYGIALFDDENKNGEIDYGWFLPNEGFAFGDYIHTKWSTPHFNNFKFTLSADKTVTMVVRYL